MIVSALALGVLTAQFFQRQNAGDAEDGTDQATCSLKLVQPMRPLATGSRFSIRLPAFLHWIVPMLLCVCGPPAGPQASEFASEFSLTLFPVF